MTKISKPKEHKGQILPNEYKKYLVNKFYPGRSHIYKRGWRIEITTNSLFTAVRKYRSLLCEGYPVSIIRVDSKYPIETTTVKKSKSRFHDEAE